MIDYKVDYHGDKLKKQTNEQRGELVDLIAHVIDNPSSSRGILCILRENKIFHLIKYSITHGREDFGHRSHGRVMIDRSCHAMRGKRQTSLFALSQMRSVNRIISSGDVVARGFECRFANNIIYSRSLSLPIRVGLHAWL